MWSFVHVFGVITAVILSRAEAGPTINDTNTLFKDVLTAYNKYTRPVEDQGETLNVSVELYIKTLKELDEVQGTLSFIGGLILSWRDLMIRWDPAQYGGVSNLKLRFSHVWVPDLLLVNQAEHTDSLGQSWHIVDYSFDGHALWNPGGLITSSCEISVRYYPFDIQTCDVHFFVQGYTSQEIRVKEKSDEVNTSLYTSNPSWEIIKTNVESRNFTGTKPGIVFRLHLKRKPGFVIVNIVMPILFLSLLNVLAFVIVPESGERVSYCITVLLSLAVFLTIVSDNLPKSSEPIPLISYKLMVDMVISSSITFMTILNLNIYHKSDEDKVPEWIQSLYQCLAYRGFTNSSNTIQKSIFKSATASHVIPTPQSIHTDMLSLREDVRYQGDASLESKSNTLKRENADPFLDGEAAEHQSDTHMKDMSKLNKTSADAATAVNTMDGRIGDPPFEHISDTGLNQVPPVTWRKISRMLDWVFLITFTLASVASFVSFLVISI